MPGGRDQVESADATAIDDRGTDRGDVEVGGTSKKMNWPPKVGLV